MLKDVQLTLMIGPVVAVPVPQAVLDALTSVQVVCNSGGTPSGFELAFTLSNQSPLHTLFLLSGGSSLPIVRVVIVATVNGTPDVLIDGVMTNHDVSPGSGGYSTLTVKGKDLTALMDIIPFDGLPYPAMPRIARVYLILAKYLALGIVPVAVPPILEGIPNPLDSIPRHQGTDLQYLQAMAEDAGYVFYVSPGPLPLTNIAYWGPDIKVGPVQPALNINMDAHTNVDSLSFTFDKESKEMPIVWIQMAETKLPIPIPIPDITPLNPPLGLVPPLPVKIRFLDDTAGMGPLEAALTGLAYAAKH